MLLLCTPVYLSFFFQEYKSELVNAETLNIIIVNKNEIRVWTEMLTVLSRIQIGKVTEDLALKVSTMFRL